jgi:NADP-dependent 3-hydroxy acid dehydrogenase YdfG
MAVGRGTAVVTGASSGIGAATAGRGAGVGSVVVGAARRADRIESLAAELGGRAIVLDVTDPSSVDQLAATVSHCTVLVANAGGAVGQDPVETADPADWAAMYDVNVLGTLRCVQALLPALRAGAGATGSATIVLLGSIAGHLVYPGGAGYCGAKHAVAALGETLRLELSGQPVRIVEIAPGMVETEEFSLNRFAGDAERAAAVYAGVEHPLTADDIADCIAFAVTRPAHVDIDLMVIKPIAQAAPWLVTRSGS